MTNKEIRFTEACLQRLEKEFLRALIVKNFVPYIRPYKLKDGERLVVSTENFGDFVLTHGDFEEVEND